jgi:hypothetical protein
MSNKDIINQPLNDIFNKTGNGNCNSSGVMSEKKQCIEKF